MILKGKVVRHFCALSIEVFKLIYKIRHMGVFSSEITAHVTELQSSPKVSLLVVPIPATLTETTSVESDFPTNAVLKREVGFR